MSDLRCILITNGNLLSLLSLANWLRRFRTQIAAVYLTRRLPSERSNLVGMVRMLRRCGFEYAWFKIWMNAIAPRTFRRKGLPGSVADYIRSVGGSIEVREVDDVNDSAVVAGMADRRPDLLVSCSATQRFHGPLLKVPAVGAVNVHFGALPAYAGLSPYFWHLFNAEPRFGVTLHSITDRLDAGPIIEQSFGEMSDAKTVLEVALRMTECVSPMLCRFFEGKTSLAQARPQDLSKRSYFGHPTRNQMREFRRRGLRMMDHASISAFAERIRDLESQNPHAHHPT